MKILCYGICQTIEDYEKEDWIEKDLNVVYLKYKEKNEGFKYLKFIENAEDGFRSYYIIEENIEKIPENLVFNYDSYPFEANLNYFDRTEIPYNIGKLDLFENRHINKSLHDEDWLKEKSDFKGYILSKDGIDIGLFGTNIDDSYYPSCVAYLDIYLIDNLLKETKEVQ